MGCPEYVFHVFKLFFSTRDSSIESLAFDSSKFKFQGFSYVCSVMHVCFYHDNHGLVFPRKIERLYVAKTRKPQAICIGRGKIFLKILSLDILS